MELLNKVKSIYAEACVSIIFNTHRTKPSYQKDEINLKNYVNEIEKKLSDKYSKKFVLPIMKNLNKVVASINHSFNLESMIIYANSDFSEYTRLPIEVEDRVVIDYSFATRDLIRAMHSESAYYVLVLSRQKARLIEAYGDKVVKELTGEFVMTNFLFTTDKSKLSTNKGQDNLIEEFFNRVDKNVMLAIKNHNLPILLVTETRNFFHYKKIADKKEFIIGHINGNKDKETARNIISDAWQVMLPLIKEKNALRIKELEKAVSEGKFLSDTNEIWNAIQHGKGRTLFVKKGYFQPVIIQGNHIKLTNSLRRDSENFINDIIDEMIEQTMSFGGDVIFMEGDELKEFNNLALLLRY